MDDATVEFSLDRILEQRDKLAAECPMDICEIQTRTAELKEKHAEQLRSSDAEKSLDFAQIESIMDFINDNSQKAADG
jgi:hypothetical protein